MKISDLNLVVNVNTDQLNQALQKVNQLKGLLTEANALIASLKAVNIEIEVAEQKELFDKLANSLVDRLRRSGTLL